MELKLRTLAPLLVTILLISLRVLYIKHGIKRESNHKKQVTFSKQLASLDQATPEATQPSRETMTISNRENHTKTRALKGGEGDVKSDVKSGTVTDEPARLVEYLTLRNFSSLYDSCHATSWPKDTLLGSIYSDVSERFLATNLPRNPEIDGFLAQRDNFWRNSTEELLKTKSRPKTQCRNCAINASCYNMSNNLWHPAKVSAFCFSQLMLPIEFWDPLNQCLLRVNQNFLSP